MAAGNPRFEVVDGTMREAEFRRGVAWLHLVPELGLTLRGEGQDDDPRGGEPAVPPSPDRSPPGLGTLTLTEGSFDRDRSLAGLSAA